MIDLIVIACLALAIGIGLRIYLIGRPKKPDEFDGGFRHNHPRVTTTIYTGGAVPEFIRTKGND